MNLKTKLLSKIIILALLFALIPVYSLNKSKATNEVQKTLVAYDISLEYISEDFGYYTSCDKVSKEGDTGGYYYDGSYSGHYGITDASFNKEGEGGYFIYKFVYIDNIDEKENPPQSIAAGITRSPDFYVLPEGQTYEDHLDCTYSELSDYIQNAGYGTTGESFGPIARAETYKVYTDSTAHNSVEYLKKDSDDTIYTYQAHMGDDGNSYNLALKTTAVDVNNLVPVMVPAEETTIDTLNISIEHPIEGNQATNTTKPNVRIDEDAGYELDFTAFVTAYPSEMPTGYDEPFVGTFEKDHSYYVEVSLHAEDGYVFAGNNNMTLRVNGKTLGYEMSQWNMEGSTYYMFWAKVNTEEEVQEPEYRVVYDFNGGTRNGQSSYVTYQVSYAPNISKYNFIDWLGVEPPSGKELDAIEINGVRYELGTGYMLNKDTTYKYIWKDKSVPHAHEYKTVTTKATLGKDGSITEKCDGCGNVKSTITIPSIKTINLSKTSFTYNKKVQKPSVKVVGSDGKTIASSNYDIKYSNNNSKKIGEYSITITFKGNYEGTNTYKYRINPKGTSLSKLKTGRKQFEAIWKAQKNETTGYEIQYSTDKKFKSGNKKVTIKKNKTTSVSFNKLKAKNKYYVRIRTYKTVKGKKFYSDWSKALNVKTKK